MTKVAFSGEEQSLAIIWQWYQDIQAGLNGYQGEILNALFQGKSVNEPFLFMTKENVLDYFAKQKNELENLVSLNIMASVEAAIRMDYLKRVYARKKKKRYYKSPFSRIA